MAALPDGKPPLPPGWRFHRPEFMYEDDKLDSLRLDFNTPKGEIDFLMERLDEHPQFAEFKWDEDNGDWARLACDDDRDVDGEVLDLALGLIRQTPGLVDLAAGRYFFRWHAEVDMWSAILDEDDEIGGRDEVEVAQCIAPSDIPGYECYTIYPANALDMEEVTSGLAIATPKSGDTQQKFFVKYCKRKPKENFLREISTLHAVRHPSIIKVFGLLADSTNYVIGVVFPFAVYGDLKAQTAATDRQKLQWMQQILDALIYLKNNGTPYTDLKCSNVVVGDSKRAILIDFDGGYTPRKNKASSESFGLGVMLEDLTCSAPAIGEFVQGAKTNMWSLEESLAQIDAILRTL